MITSISNLKGGVGKTSLTLGVASVLARAWKEIEYKEGEKILRRLENPLYTLKEGEALTRELEPKRVLVIDLDPQANTTSIFGRDHLKKLRDANEQFYKEDSIYSALVLNGELKLIDTYLPTLKLVGATKSMSEVDILLYNEQNREDTQDKEDVHLRLKKKLDQVKDQYDYILIDCPPNLGLAVLNAYTASDNILIPTDPGKFGVDALEVLDNVIEMVKANYNPHFAILKILLNMYDPYNESDNTKKKLSNHNKFAHYLCEIEVPKNNEMRNAQGKHMDVIEWNKYSTSARAIIEITHRYFL